MTYLVLERLHKRVQSIKNRFVTLLGPAESDHGIARRHRRVDQVLRIVSLAVPEASPHGQQSCSPQGARRSAATVRPLLGGGQK
jgi:hypothetical protein